LKKGRSRSSMASDQKKGKEPGEETAWDKEPVGEKRKKPQLGKKKRTAW